MERLPVEPAKLVTDVKIGVHNQTWMPKIVYSGSIELLSLQEGYLLDNDEFALKFGTKFLQQLKEEISKKAPKLIK